MLLIEEQVKAIMRHTKPVILLLLSALLTLGVGGCATNEEAATTDTGGTYTVARGDLAQEVSASGNLSFSNLEDLAFEMAGTVQDVFVEEGGAVKKGDVVATLDTTDWEKQIRSLKISVLSSQISLRQAAQALDTAKEQTQTTITGDVVVNCCPDQEEIRIKEMQLEQAQLRLEDAQAALDEQLSQSPEVVAPFDGFVTKVTAQGGDEVFKGSVAVTIVDPNQFEALIYVSENDIALVKVGTQAQGERGLDERRGIARRGDRHCPFSHYLVRCSQLRGHRTGSHSCGGAGTGAGGPGTSCGGTPNNYFRSAPG